MFLMLHRDLDLPTRHIRLWIESCRWTLRMHSCRICLWRSAQLCRRRGWAAELSREDVSRSRVSLWQRLMYPWSMALWSWQRLRGYVGWTKKLQSVN